MNLKPFFLFSCLPLISLLHADDFKTGTDNARTFREACEKGSAEDVQFFLDNGADPNRQFVVSYRTESGHYEMATPLAFAARHNSNAGAIEALVKAKAQVSSFSALHEAAGNNPSVEVAQALINAGEDINAEHLLIVAAQKNPNPQVLECLLDAGAQNNPGILLFASLKNANTAMFEMLKKRFGGVDACGQSGNTALMWASASKDSSRVKRLLELGADSNKRNSRGETPLMFAVTAANRETVEALVGAGADVQVKLLNEIGLLELSPRKSDQDKHDELRAYLESLGVKAMSRAAFERLQKQSREQGRVRRLIPPPEGSIVDFEMSELSGIRERRVFRLVSERDIAQE